MTVRNLYVYRNRCAEELPANGDGTPDMRFWEGRELVAQTARDVAAGRAGLPGWLPLLRDGRVDARRPVGRIFLDLCIGPVTTVNSVHIPFVSHVFISYMIEIPLLIR